MQSEPINFKHRFSDLEALVEKTDGNTCPFYTPSFFEALEESGSTIKARGWQAHHYYNPQHSLVIPGYLKDHSYGEFIFDWSIADAIMQAGYAYYPKWVSQLPFTPISMSSPAFHAQSSTSHDNLRQSVETLLESLGKQSILTAQFLYPHQALSDVLEPLCIARQSIQFEWENNQYQSFDDFLSDLSQKRAKEVRRERRKIQSLDLQFDWKNGDHLTPTVIDQFVPFYQRTYMKRSGHYGYLNQEFFQRWLTLNKNQVHLLFAYEGEQPVAAALFLSDNSTLFGRYYGSILDDQGLHFECCYYRGIELAIKKGLQRFNPGVQGEHKVRRGFRPYKLTSYYRYFNAALEKQIGRLFKQEETELDDYLNYLNQRLPFR
ncbi:GNAT family N-acetyltransferase [Pleionea litopenaei]|uniref:GNAT family N-acetyltransferase n=1 Tax=Pleionea litopenaei TaxID=3070815 RepID=A0AA51X752_9GAMM|nr:GNAT family N-acetyltransferase [Pleionea sp. HL-JVS1]WMS87967.1 GNAT family N-acetyltransferase [Pleionea sp. HL-JVS1]